MTEHNYQYDPMQFLAEIPTANVRPHLIPTLADALEPTPALSIAREVIIEQQQRPLSEKELDRILRLLDSENRLQHFTLHAFTEAAMRP